MGLLSVENLTKSFGVQTVLRGVSFEIQENDRIGLVGINGSGKTTLLRLLTGELPPDGGTIAFSGAAVPGYMEQHVCRNLERSAYDEVLTVFDSLFRMEAELDEISRALQKKPEHPDQLIERQAALNDRLIRLGGLTCRSRARSSLLSLGFSEEQMQLPVGALSGGQKAKLQLAKLLLCGANLLLLDEPTNHLDLSSIEWLEDFLRSYRGAFLVISHDRYFLDRICGRIFELEHRRLTPYKGDYSSYLMQKEENGLSAQRKYDRTQKEIKRLEGIVEQQRRWNREKNIKTAESKEKMIDRLKQSLEKPEDKPEELRFRFGIGQRGGNDVLTVENLALRFGESELFHSVGMKIHREERIFLIGPNGCGKTSFLKTLLGIYPPAAGAVRLGAGIEVGYYDQIQEGLHPEKTVLDEIWDSYPQMTQTELRNALAIFLFQGDEVFKPVSALSGGERARVLLLRLMLSRSNFLLLDEPTNHLDIGSCEALEAALKSYEGTLLIVSHDRYLINKLADRIYFLGPNGAEEFAGNYDAFLEKSRGPSREPKADEPEKDEKGTEYRKQKEQRAQVRREKAEMRRIEQEMEQTEREVDRLKAELADPAAASDYEAAIKLTGQIAELSQSDERLFSRWSVLAQKYGE